MGYISNQIKTGISSQLKQINPSELTSQAKNVAGKVWIDTDKLATYMDIDTPVEAIKNNVKLGDTTLNQLKLPAGVTNRIPKPVNNILGNVKLPTEIGGVSIPTLPDLSSVSSNIENFISAIGFDTSIFNDLGIKDISSILKEPDLSSLASVPSVDIPTVEMPDMTEAYKDLDFSALGADIESISQKFPEVNDLKNFL